MAFVGGEMSKSPVDTESATIAGYWLGLVSFVIGLVGIALTIYAMFAKDINALLIAGSGWLAALMVGFGGWITTVKLLRHTKSCEQDLLQAKLETEKLRSEFDRLLIISDYLVSKTVRRATRRAVPVQTEYNQAENENADQI